MVAPQTSQHGCGPLPIRKSGELRRLLLPRRHVFALFIEAAHGARRPQRSITQFLIDGIAQPPKVYARRTRHSYGWRSLEAACTPTLDLARANVPPRPVNPRQSQPGAVGTSASVPSSS